MNQLNIKHDNVVSLFLYGFCWNTTCGCRLSIISLGAAVQSPCSVYTISLIVAMSDRRSAAADISQAQQARHHRGESENASLILKRKRLWRKREGSIFFLAHSLFAVYQNTGCTVWFLFPCNYLVPIQTSCGLCGWDPVSSGATWPWKECVSRCWEASISYKQLLFRPTETHRGHEVRNDIEENVFENQRSISTEQGHVVTGVIPVYSVVNMEHSCT